MHIPRFLLSAAAVAAVASPALAADDTAQTTAFVRLGHPVRVVAINQSERGDSTSTTWVIVRDNGRLLAVDVQPNLRAETAEIVTAPGRHLLTAKCGNHIATVKSCTVTAAPVG
ncbi:MAG: hypothetical protein JWO81_2701 [Alphaproteobacteria bacterium]|nr:hypothetical protein [Alphaproteobacteria bacterium]